MEAAILFFCLGVSIGCKDALLLNLLILVFEAIFLECLAFRDENIEFALVSEVSERNLDRALKQAIKSLSSELFKLSIFYLI